MQRAVGLWFEALGTLAPARLLPCGLVLAQEPAWVSRPVSGGLGIKQLSGLAFQVAEVSV